MRDRAREQEKVLRPSESRAGGGSGGRRGEGEKGSLRIPDLQPSTGVPSPATGPRGWDNLQPRGVKPPRTFIAALLAPSLLLYGVFVLVPAFNAFRYSLTRWDGLSAPVWVGFKNFADIAKRRGDFLTALAHNVYLMVVPGVFILSFALFFAYSLHRRIAGARLFRVAFFFPNVISSVAVSLLWILVYSTTDVGLLNNTLKLLFHGHLPPILAGWLGATAPPVAFTQSSRLLTALPPMMIWGATGFYMVLFLASMESIPEDYYEAARLDGASNGRTFFAITLPLMWDVLTTGVVYLVIGGLKIFDTVWVMENGRPGKDTHTIATLMYSKVFEEYNIGFGTAIAVCLFLLTLLATRITFRLLRRERLEY